MGYASGLLLASFDLAGLIIILFIIDYISTYFTPFFDKIHNFHYKILVSTNINARYVNFMILSYSKHNIKGNINNFIFMVK